MMQENSTNKSTNTMKENEYIWEVHAENRDDEDFEPMTRIEYFTEMNYADERIKQLEKQDYTARKKQITLYQENGEWFNIEKHKVVVDANIKRLQALAKLTKEERDLLGIK